MGIPIHALKIRRAPHPCSSLSFSGPLLTVLLLTAVMLMGALPASNLDRKVRFSIAAQPVESALVTFSRQARIQVVIASGAAGTAESPALNTTMYAREALNVLLRNSGLKYAAQGSSISVTPLSDGLASLGNELPLPRSYIPMTDPVSSESVGSESVGVDQRSLQTSAPEPDLGRERGSGLAVVIVTAEKRSERLQDVPVPVTVLSADTMAEQNQNRIQDYFATVPGLNMSAAPFAGGQQSLSIRGITTGSLTNPSVGVTIDDVPYGSSTLIAIGSLLYPDIDPSDLERIEVLRGPQGTLYGASSMGGLIKFVTKDPSTGDVSGHIQMLGDEVDHGEFGYGVRGVVNVPLSDTFAIRGSGFTRRDPGYIENIITGQRDVNRADVYGGRLSSLWRPSDVVSLKLSALLQNTNGDGSPSIDVNNSLQPVYGPQEQAAMRGTGGYSLNARLYTANLTAKLASLDFVSVTGYGDNKYTGITDLSAVQGSLAQFGIPPIGFDGYGVSGASQAGSIETKKFTQEFRLSSASGHTLEWLAGAFYTHESSPADTKWLANNPTTGLPVGELIDFNYPTTLSEYALFGDLTAHFTGRFDVQFGGRESEDRQTYNETDSGPVTLAFFGSPPPFINDEQRSKGNAFTYLVTPRFKLSPNIMLYARFTSGYRVGGNNVNAVVYNLPSNFAPDKTNNYELGVKGSVLDRALTFDASAYHVDWKNIQLSLSTPVGVYNANGGNAKSQGLELSVQARPARGLTITTAATISDAQLTQDLPAASSAVGLSGDRLPFSSRFSGSVSVDQDVALTGNWTGFVGGSLVYVGERQGEFNSIYALSQMRFRYPAYGYMDLKAGVRGWSWTVNLFVNNISDRRGVVGGEYGTAGEPGASGTVTYMRPRTVGLSVSRDF